MSWISNRHLLLVMQECDGYTCDMKHLFLFPFLGNLCMYNMPLNITYSLPNCITMESYFLLWLNLQALHSLLHSSCLSLETKKASCVTLVSSSSMLATSSRTVVSSPSACTSFFGEFLCKEDCFCIWASTGLRSGSSRGIDKGGADLGSGGGRDSLSPPYEGTPGTSGECGFYAPVW